MTDEKAPSQKQFQEAVDEMQAAVIEYYRTNTEEDDARREAEEDARIKAFVERLSSEGKLP